MTTNPPGNGDRPRPDHFTETISDIVQELDRIVSALRIAEQKAADAHLFAKNALDGAEKYHNELSGWLESFRTDR